MATIMRVGGGGGGSLAIEVVGGTTKPANPKDNTIWVSTDVEIGTAMLSPNAPEIPVVGDVWVNTGNKYNLDGTNASSNLLMVSDNPYLEINVLNILQWDGSAWVARHGSSIYANGAWTGMALYIFEYGVTNNDYPIKAGGSTSNTNKTGSLTNRLTFVDDYAQITIPKYEYAVMWTTKPVDFSNFNRMSAVVMPTTLMGCFLGIGAEDASQITPSNYNSYGEVKMDVAGSTRGTLELDCSGISGRKTPTISMGGGSGSERKLNIYYWALTV